VDDQAMLVAEVHVVRSEAWDATSLRLCYWCRCRRWQKWVTATKCLLWQTLEQLMTLTVCSGQSVVRQTLRASVSTESSVYMYC